MRDILVVIRRLALGAVVLSALAVPVGASLLFTPNLAAGATPVHRISRS